MICGLTCCRLHDCVVYQARNAGCTSRLLIFVVLMEVFESRISCTLHQYFFCVCSLVDHEYRLPSNREVHRRHCRGKRSRGRPPSTRNRFRYGASQHKCRARRIVAEVQATIHASGRLHLRWNTLCTTRRSFTSYRR